MCLGDVCHYAGVCRYSGACRRNESFRSARCASGRGGVRTEARSIWLGFERLDAWSVRESAARRPLSKRRTRTLWVPEEWGRRRQTSRRFRFVQPITGRIWILIIVWERTDSRTNMGLTCKRSCFDCRVDSDSKNKGGGLQPIVAHSQGRFRCPPDMVSPTMGV